MIFLNNNDLLSVIDQTTLDAITDSNQTFINNAELSAIEEMNAYLNVRYDIAKVFDINNRNASIVMHLVDIVLYHLHARISPDNIPTLREDRYNNAKDWLEKVADGFIKPLLPVKEIEDSTPLRYGSGDKQESYF